MPLNDPPYSPPPGPTPQTPENTQATPDSPVFILDTIPVPDGLASIPDSSRGYLAWGQTILIDEDLGLRAQPVAAAKGSALVEFSRVHTGYAVRVVEGLAVRADQEPEVPAAEGQGDNDVLVRKTRLAFNLQPLPDGSPLFATAWRYIFVCQTDPGYQTPLDRGSTPLNNMPAPAHTIDVSKWVAYYLGPFRQPVSGPTIGGSIDY